MKLNSRLSAVLFLRSLGLFVRSPSQGLKRLLFLLICSIPASLFGQLPAIGIIDYYGVHELSIVQVQQALQIKLGERLSESSIPDVLVLAKQRLEAISGVLNARLELVCCDAGKTILYVGIEERGAQAPHFRTAPKGSARLPAEIVAAGDAFQKALMEAILQGDASEDHSQGHTLNHNPALRAIQERYITLATRDLVNLRDVLRNSADVGQRALAAQVIGYAPEKRVVVTDLGYGMLDPDSSVRNNAMRVLWVIAGFAQEHPELKIEIDSHPFVEMLNSVVWTDRNKSSAALMALTGQRDSVLLTDLRKHALTSLVEMARWKSAGHANPAYVILGRIAGLSEKQISDAWDRNDRETVIAAASKAASRD